MNTNALGVWTMILGILWALGLVLLGFSKVYILLALLVSSFGLLIVAASN